MATSKTAQTFQILSLGAVGLAIVLALLPQTGHDQLWLLLAAQRGGSEFDPYGPTVFETNPPLALWLLRAVGALGSKLPLALTVTFKSLIVALVASSGLACYRLFKRLYRLSRASATWAFAFVWIVLMGVIPARDFGQRDHVLVLLVAPYLLVAALYASGRPVALLQRVAIVLAAGVGLALKPHQALIAVAVESALLWSAGSEQPSVWRRARVLEPCVLLACAAAYGAAVDVLAPTYFSTILPVLRETYWAFGHLSPPQVMARSPELHGLAAVTLFLLRRTPAKRTTLSRVLVCAAVAGTFAFYLQGTGWYYQELPALTFFGFAFALELHQIALSFARQGRASPALSTRAPVAALALALLAPVLATYFSNFVRLRGDPLFTGPFLAGLAQRQEVPDPTFFEGLPAGSAVATLTTAVDDTVPPVFRYHLTLAQRYPHLWMLPAILRNESAGSPKHRIEPVRLAELERMQHAFMVEDLRRWHPALILVERCQDAAVHCQVLEDRHDDLLAWFRQDPRFEELFHQYRFLRSSGPYDAFVLR